MKRKGVIVTAAGLIALAVVAAGQETPEKKKGAAEVSFTSDVLPIIKQHCLPCHAQDNDNPSELALDDFDLMKAGGRHGDLFVSGKSKESLLIQKFGEDPPFGGRMPLNPKKKIQEGKAKWLSDDEVKIIALWIDQGAKKN